MAKANLSHDFSIFSAAGAEIGLMCFKDKGGTPMYAKGTLPSITDAYHTGSPDYAATRAEEELRLIQSDYRGGAGLEYVGRPDTEKRYHYTINGDARFANEFRLAGLPTTVTKPTITTAVLANGDMELDASWTNGTRSSTVKHAGTYSMRVATSSTVYQDLTWHAEYQGQVFSFSVWGYSINGKFLCTIDDGVGTTSSAEGGSTSWTQFTVTRQLSASATRLRVQFSNSDANQYAYGDDAAFEFQPTVGAISCQCDFNSVRYASYGNTLMKLNAGGTAYTYVYSFPATITDLCSFNVSGTDYLFICIGWSNEYWYMVAAETFTESTLSINAKFMDKSGVTLHCSDTNSTIQRATNPLNAGSWGTSKQMGEDAYNIVDLKVFGGLPYVKKSDCKVYYLTSADVVTTLVSGAANTAGTNTSRMYVWREETLLIPYGEQGLLRYDGTDITHIDPALYMNNASDFAGQVSAVSGDDQYLYIVMDDSTDIQILSGRDEIVDGTNGWRWHPLNTITMTNCASADITSIYKKRMYIGSDTYTDSLYYIPITTKYGSIASDSNYTYLTGGYLITPWIHANLRGDKKAWIKITLTLGHTYDADIYFDGYYKKLNDSSWTFIGAFKGSATSKSTTQYIPVDAGSLNPSSEMMQFKFVGATDDTSKTPILLSYEIQAIWYPPQKQIIYTTVQVEKGQALKQEGQIETVANSAITAMLDELYNPATAYPRQMYPIDYVSTSYYVKALPPQKSWVAKSDKGESLKWIYELQLEVIPIS